MVIFPRVDSSKSIGHSNGNAPRVTQVNLGSTSVRETPLGTIHVSFFGSPFSPPSEPRIIRLLPTHKDNLLDGIFPEKSFQDSLFHRHYRSLRRPAPPSSSSAGGAAAAEPGAGALRREALGEAPPVRAVVVDHVSPPHGAHPPPAGGVQRLVHPPRRRVAALRRRPQRRRRAALAGEVPERGHERRLRPVGLHEPSLRGPVVGIPQARVEPHRPPRREGHAGFRQVLEVPDWDAVDGESAEAEDEEEEEDRIKNHNQEYFDEGRLFPSPRRLVTHMMRRGVQRME